MRVIAIGKSKKNIWQGVEDEYLKRLKVFVSLEIQILPASRQEFDQKIIFDEGQRVLEKVGERDFVVALDMQGESISSDALAGKIDKWQVGGKNIVFVVGGTYGLSQLVLERADFVWKLSGLTFTHDMVRSIVLEQIYRAFMIMKGKSYHH